jgi:hypothetical protein
MRAFRDATMTSLGCDSRSSYVHGIYCPPVAREGDARYEISPPFPIAAEGFCVRAIHPRVPGTTTQGTRTLPEAVKRPRSVYLSVRTGPSPAVNLLCLYILTDSPFLPGTGVISGLEPEPQSAVGYVPRR